MLVPIKFQVILVIISLKIHLLRWVVILTFGTQLQLQLYLSCISWSNLQEKIYQSLPRGRTQLHEGGPPQGTVLKAEVKVILTAGTHRVRVLAIEIRSLEYDGCFDRCFAKVAQDLHQIDRGQLH